MARTPSASPRSENLTDVDAQACADQPATPRGTGRWRQAALRPAVSAERLEPRRLLSAVSWVGASSGDFSDPTNWSTGQVPATADDVTINVPAGITVTFSGGGVAINSLTTNAPFVLSGGDLTITGPLDLSNTFTLSGGNLHQASVVGAANLAFTSAGGSLDHVSVDSDLALSDPSASFTVQPGGLAMGGHTLHVSGDGAAVHFASNQTFDFGKILFEGTNELLGVDSGGVLTLGASTTVEGGGATLGQYASTGTLDNKGLIVADASGKSLDIQANGFTNEGSVQATSGGAFGILGDGWINTGSMAALVGGTLNLAGSIPTANLGSIDGTAGTVNLQAGLDNHGASFALTATTGSWNLAGGIISGGTLDFTGGAALNFTSGGGALDAVTADNDLVLGDNATVNIINGLTLGSNAVNLQGDHASITFDGTQTLASGSINLTGTNDTLGIVGNNTLTLGPAVTVVGGAGAQIGVSAGEGLSSPTLVNQGAIFAAGVGATTVIAPDIFQNQGTVVVSGAASLAVAPVTSWSNTGTLSATAGGTLVLGGATTTAGLGSIDGANGTVNLKGTLDNTNATLTLDGTTGNWNLTGGTVQGGSLTFNGASLNFTSAGGLLDGVTANNDLLLSDPGARVSVQNGLGLGTSAVHLQGDSAVLNFVGSQTLASGQILFEGTNEAVSETPLPAVPMTLTLGPSANVTGTGGVLGSPGATLDNQGGIAIDTEGGTIQVPADTFDNEGLIEAIGATVDVTGGYNATPASAVNIGFAADGHIGLFQVSGTAALAGTLRVLAGYNPPQGSTYTVVTYTQSTGGFDSIQINTSPSVTLVPTVGSTSITLYTQTAPPQTVNWIGPDGGDFDNPVNWSTGQVPGAADDVVIYVSPGATVTHSTGSDTVQSLTSNALFDLSGGTLTVSTTLSLQNTFTLSGGTLSGASVQGAFNLAFTPAGGTLDAVTVDSDLFVAPDNAAVAVTGGLNLGSSTIHLSGSGDAIVFQDDETLSSGFITFDASNDGIGIGNGSTLTLGPAAKVYAGDGGNVGFGPGATTLVNKGAILVGAPSPNTPAISARPASVVRPAVLTAPQPVAILAAVFTNQGLVEADNGTLAISPSTAWTNAGTFAAKAGAMLDLGGSTTTAGLGSVLNTGGTVDLSGTVDNSNDALVLDDSNGPWNLTGGTIHGGTLTVSGSNLNFTAVGGTFDGVTAGADLNLASPGARLDVSHGLDLGGHALNLIGDGATVNFVGDQALDNGTVSLLGAGDALTQGGRSPVTLTFGAGLVVQQAGGSDARLGTLGNILVNQGTVTAAAPGQAIQVNASTFTNQGLLQANADIISVNGDFNAAPGSEIGITFDAAGPGRVNVAGTANLAGTLNISDPAAAAAPGASYDVLTYATSSGAFSSVGGLATPSVTFIPTFGPNAVSLFALGGPTDPGSYSALKITGPFYTPGTYQPGDTVPFRATEQDTGPIPTGPFEVDVVLSIDQVYGNDDDVVVLSRQEDSLDPGQMRLMTNFVQIPADAPPGKYYVLGQLFFPDSTSSSTNTAAATDGSTPAVGSASPGAAHQPFVSDLNAPTGTTNLSGAPDGSGGMSRGYVSPTANIIVSAARSSSSGDGSDPGSLPPPAKVGGLDPGFGNAGVAAHNVGFTSTADVTLQADGQSVIVGSYGTPGAQNFGVTRYSADGGIDPNFGAADTPGVATVDFGGDDAPCAVAMLPNGKILVAGTSTRLLNGQPAGSEFAIARFNADGSLDTTFGNGTGKVLVDFSPNAGVTSNDVARALVVASDGTIYLAGSSDAGGRGKDFAVAALNSDGSPDAAFGKAGKVLLDFAGGDDAIAGIALQRDGSLVLAGSAASPGGAPAVALVRLLPGGALDARFGKKGLVVTSVRGVDDEAASVAVDSSGRIVVGGLSATGSAAAGTLASDFLVIRYTKAGKVDRTFGRGPVVTRFNQPSAVTRILVESDGSVVASGRTTSGLSDLDVTQLDVALARYTAKGTLDKSFNSTGTAVFSLNGEADPSAVSSKHGVGNSRGGAAGPTVGDSSGSGSLKQKFSQFEQSSQGALAQNSGGQLFDVGTSGADTSEASIVASGVDLSVRLTANLPAKAFGGAKATASVQLSNAGSLPVSGPVTINLYASPNPQPDAGQSLIQGFSQKLSLRPNQSKTFPLKFTFPASLPSGSYYLLATVGSSSLADLDLSNNTDVSASAVAVSKPAVDLVGGTLSAPRSIARGKAASVSLSVTNAGNVLVKGTTSVQYFASTDGKLAGATSIATATGLKINLQPGAGATFSQKLVVPASLPAGSYHLLALIDPSNTLGEPDMTNNLLVSPGTFAAA